MAVSVLDSSVQFYLNHSIAPSTRKTYLTGQRKYLELCSKRQCPPYPVTEDNLCYFCAFLADEGLTHQTIKCYLSAVRHQHVSQGFADPHLSDMARLEQVLRGIKIVRAKRGEMSRTRLPITPAILRLLRKAWLSANPSYDSVMLWAVCSLCFFGFFRSGELTSSSEVHSDPDEHLTFADVAVNDRDNPTILRVHLKTSKTDPFRSGVDVFVGKTGNDLCPVTAMVNYLARRGSRDGALFAYEDGRFLTRESLIVQVRDALSASGLDASKYSGHSFRSGAATTALEAGISDAAIQMLGRWKSDAYKRYIKTPKDQLATFSAQLAKQ